jgi:hypothetical protein
MKVDRLTTDELRALDAYEQIGALNELFGEIKRLGDDKNKAMDLLGDAKILAIEEPSPTNKAMVIRATSTRDKLTTMLSVRKEQIRILQTLLKAVPH